MNGIHDMGGRRGFGRVEIEPDEPVFHARWEARVFGMVMTMPGGNLDAGRHAIERLDAAAYLRHGYYGRWLSALEQTLTELGVVTAAEVEQRMGAAPSPVPAAGTRHLPARRPAPAPDFTRAVGRAPRFSEGQPVRTRDHQPAGHTRLPAYARCRCGVVTDVHPAMVYPDDHAHGRGETPHYVYTVRFAGTELWGPRAEPHTLVHLDLFEPYLEAA